MRRQQTLRASVDWSHALLTEPERILFRRLAVFLGGFDLDAAQAVAGDDRRGALPSSRSAHPARRQVAWWSPKTPVAERDTGYWRRCASMRRRSSASPAKPTTVRVTAPRPLHVDGSCCSTRLTARDYGRSGSSRPKSRWTTSEAAFGWSRENGDIERALELASSLQPLWLTRGRILEGLAWFDSVLTDDYRSSTLLRLHARTGARRQGRARLRWSAYLQHGSGGSRPWRSRANSTIRRCWSGRSPPAEAPPSTTPRWPGRTSPRRSSLARALGDSVEVVPDSRPAGSMRRSSPATQSRRGRPPKKDATSPTPSVTASDRGSVGWRLAMAHADSGPPDRSDRRIARGGRRGRGRPHDVIMQRRPDSWCCRMALAYHGDSSAALATAAEAAIAVRCGSRRCSTSVRATCGDGHRRPGRR